MLGQKVEDRFDGARSRVSTSKNIGQQITENLLVIDIVVLVLEPVVPINEEVLVLGLFGARG
jgi:hypothetical protein